MAAQTAQATGAALMNVLAHVPGGNTAGGEIREAMPRNDGFFHLDTPGTIARLNQLHANNYNYLIWNSITDWDDLQREFLPAAQHAGITVWVYLVPPTESVVKYSAPFRTDYMRWAAELAKLSLRYPCLQAWSIDDFSVNLKLYTPEYVKQLQETAHTINPKLRFFPVMVLNQVGVKWANAYGPYIDGVVAPYIDMPYYNTQRVNSLDPKINSADAALKPWHVVLYPLIYVGRHLGSPLEPTPQYAKAAISICLKAMQEQRIGGIVSYGTALQKDAGRTRTNPALDGYGRLSFEVTKFPNKAGDWAEASQTVTVNPNAAQYWLSFWHHDRWSKNDGPGRLLKEVLLDDKVVWHADPAGINPDTWFEGGPLSGVVNVTTELKNKNTAKLTLRMRTLKDFSGDPIDAGFDRLKGIGFTIGNPGFETNAAWDVHDSGGAMLAAIDHHDPDNLRKVFAAVSAAFGSYGHPHRATTKHGKDR